MAQVQGTDEEMKIIEDKNEEEDITL